MTYIFPTAQLTRSGGLRIFTVMLVSLALHPTSVVGQNPTPVNSDDKTLSRAAFTQIVTRFEEDYVPFVSEHYRGRKIEFRSDYDDTMVTSGQPHSVYVNARFLTFASIDESGFTLSTCWEFQKFLTFRNQSAHYAHALHYLMVPNCLRQLWKHDHVANSAYRHITPPYLKSLCDQSHSNRSDRELCYRTTWASYSLARSKEDPITIDQPSPKKADGIATRHQGMQCMFDVLLASSLCTKGQLNPKVDTLDDFLEYSCTAEDDLPAQAALPKCFYNPQ